MTARIRTSKSCFTKKCTKKSSEGGPLKGWPLKSVLLDMIHFLRESHKKYPRNLTTRILLNSCIGGTYTLSVQKFSSKHRQGVINHNQFCSVKIFDLEAIFTLFGLKSQKLQIRQCLISVGSGPKNSQIALKIHHLVGENDNSQIEQT